MAPKYMPVKELAVLRQALADANDVASLLSLAQWIGRHFPDDPAAKQLLADVAGKREQLLRSRSREAPVTSEPPQLPDATVP